MKIFIRNKQNKKVAVWYDDNYIWFAGDKEPSATIACNNLDYSYTHGGYLYQLACDAIWEKGL